MNKDFLEIPVKIVREQELVVGPLAWDLVKRVPGLKVDQLNKEVFVVEIGKINVIIFELVTQYERLFGLASRQVCKDAVKDVIKNLPKEEIPEILR